jgi:hypothetical protein
MKYQGWRAGTIGGVGVLAAWFVACAGEDIPPVDNDLRGALASSFGGQDSQMSGGGAAGAGGDDSGGAAGAGGRGGSAATPPGGGAGAGGSGSSVAGAGSGGGVRCDAFNTIIKSSCGLAGCHGANSSQGSFGVSEAAVLDYVDAPSEAFGSACDAVYIDSTNPENSLLYTKVIDDYPAGCGQLQMPLTGDLLDPTQQACLLDWLGQFAE